jgi:hypothetical protein
MNKSKSILILAAFVVTGMMLDAASAATIPAGTTLVVKTSTAIHARDVKGRKFQGTLARGAGTLHAGTAVQGIVQQSYYSIASSTHPLVLRLTGIVINGKMVPVKAEDFEAENSSHWFTRRGIHVTGGAFILQAGTLLPFRLTQPVDI